MARSLLDALPLIVAEGKRQAARILEGLESRHRTALQTREWVLSARDTQARDWLQDATRWRHLSTAPQEAPGDWTNRLIYGDNLLAMAALLAGDEAKPSLRGQLDLIYIDPPFDSKADYRTRIKLPGMELEQRPTIIEQFAYSDTWSDGTASYLAMMVPRLVLMRELLAETGSIYVHLDWHVGHYMKVVLDEIFGKENFQREVIWSFDTKSGYKSTVSNWVRSHDTLLYWSKHKARAYFRKTYLPYGADYLARFKKRDADGRAYRDDRGSGVRQYLDELKGIPVSDVWSDIKSFQQDATSREYLGYATQKPSTLLRRILHASCPQGGLVADFFAGSGTTAVVAESLGRRWVIADLGKPACLIARKRLIDHEARPFLYQAVGDYHVEAARSHFGRNMRIGDLSAVVLSLFQDEHGHGALPLPPEDNPLRNLGQITARGRRTLVLVDSPNKLTGAATLKRALTLRDQLMGGWDRVVVLGWNFEPAIGESVDALNDANLEVLVIPPDLIDRLKKKGDLDKLRGQVRFSSLQYLRIGTVLRERTGADEHLEVALDNYVLLSPEAINLDDGNRAKLVKAMNTQPLALVEYWAVDPDYDGEVFRSVWQDYRGNSARDGDPLRVAAHARFAVPYKAGPRRVCVRAVDVFGFEAEAVQTVPEAAP